MADTLHKQDKRLLPVGYVIVLVLIAIVGWHLYRTYSTRHGADSLLADRSLNNANSISINPFTNLVSITIEMEQTKDDSNPLVSFGDGLLKTVIQLIGPGVLEQQLNTSAREHYDLYAILIPYKVRISMGAVDPESAARFKAERDKKRQEQARIKKEEQERKQKVMLSYIDSSLVLEKLRVGQGSRFGEEVTGVFGTIINKGNKTLNEVKLRIYFLNAKGERIGETDYHPVLVTKYSLGLADKSPLRSGYRRDFGYSVEKDAPSGWSKKIEAEIVEIEFDETPVSGNTKSTSEVAKRIPASPLVAPSTAGPLVQQDNDSPPAVQAPPQTAATKPSPSSPVARPDAQPSKNAPQTDVNEVLEHADESLRKPPVVAKPAVPVQPPTTAKVSKDIGKLLSALPPPMTIPPVTSPEGKTRPSKAEPAAPGSSTASRAATVKRCPPKAEKYCPILEAAINRAWNADTNPAVRQALESAGDSTALVRIVIQPNGEIREIRINGSSGNEPYDRAVQSVLREIRALPPLPEEMKGEPFIAVTSFTYARRPD